MSDVALAGGGTTASRSHPGRFLLVADGAPLPGWDDRTLLATSGAIALLVYLVIAVSQLRMRGRFEADRVDMPVRMWAYPWLTWAVVIVIPVMLVYMATRDASRFDLAMTAIIAAAVVVVGVVTTRKRSAVDVHADHAGADGLDRV